MDAVSRVHAIRDQAVRQGYEHLVLPDRPQAGEGMSCFLCVGRFLNLSSCRSAWCEGEAVAV